MPNCRLYRIDSQPLPNGDSCDYYELRTVDENPTIQFQVSSTVYLAEWFVEADVETFTTLIEDHTDDHNRTGAVVAKQTPNGTVLEDTWEQIQEPDWFPAFCMFLDVETNHKHQLAAWDHSAPRNSLIVTSYTDDLSLFTTLAEETLPNPAIVEPLTEDLADILDSTLKSNKTV